MCDLTDLEQVVLAFQKGDTEAFKQLHKMFFAELFRFCNNLLNNEQEAEDIASDTLYKLYKGHKGFASIPSIRSFLYITARHSCISYFRKAKLTRKHKAIILPSLRVEASADDVLDGLYYEALRAHLNKYLEQLPAKQHQVLDLLYLQGYSLQEVADEMSEKVNTVKQLRHRAIQRLRQLLQSQTFIEGLAIMSFFICQLD
ncbi:RNA polymerase sigma factor [Chitinophaga sp. S165]|uniref:RNA polymerase sigma factor n=1 Tax=Chitinophaga sp. S165 TaxID=2135462 RepID=UPI000D71AB53|nr:RNA polymerase sigma factor [Chitinophaga sp. S165]PWV47071.1 RNA polymerase sigma-70 factor (ECF subfamily) [Chitinophaga sp. S165]